MLNFSARPQFYSASQFAPSLALPVELLWQVNPQAYRSHAVAVISSIYLDLVEKIIGLGNFFTAT